MGRKKKVQEDNETPTEQSNGFVKKVILVTDALKTYRPNRQPINRRCCGRT